MIIERQRDLTINLGNQTYESAKISARVSLDDSRELDAKIILAAGNAGAAADQLLTELLKEEVEYWHQITTKRDSFIHLVHEDNKAKDAK